MNVTFTLEYANFCFHVCKSFSVCFCEEHAKLNGRCFVDGFYNGFCLCCCCCYCSSMHRLLRVQFRLYSSSCRHSFMPLSMCFDTIATLIDVNYGTYRQNQNHYQHPIATQLCGTDDEARGMTGTKRWQAHDTNILISWFSIRLHALEIVRWHLECISVRLQVFFLLLFVSSCISL